MNFVILLTILSGFTHLHSIRIYCGIGRFSLTVLLLKARRPNRCLIVACALHTNLPMVVVSVELQSPIV